MKIGVRLVRAGSGGGVDVGPDLARLSEDLRGGGPGGRGGRAEVDRGPVSPVEGK